MNQKVIVFGVDGLMPELVYKFVDEGSLPHISQMLRQGACTELLPYISTWGDTNFVSFITGQAPGSCWKGQRISPDNSGNLLGYMDQQGKRCALVHFPETISAEGTNHFRFAPYWSGEGGAPFELAAPMLYSTNPQKWPQQKKSEFLGWPPSSGTLAYHEKANRKAIVAEDGELYFTIASSEGAIEKVNIGYIDEQTVMLRFDNGTDLKLSLEKWSDWVEISLGKTTGIGRFKLLACDRERKTIDLLQSQINRKQSFSNHKEIETALLDRTGPFISKWTVSVAPENLYMESGLEEGEYQALWLADAALWLLKEKNFNLFATVFRLIDETHHTCLGEYDPASPFYHPERAKACEEIMRRAYMILDRAIGKILANKEKDTLLILASDHGNVPNRYMCDIYRRMEQFDLCTLDGSGMPIMNQSQAYLKNERGGTEIFVNLKGREVEGVVEPDSYEKVQTEIFRAIATWYYDTPEGLQNVAGITVKKQDAGPLGFWGEEAGDVIFSYNQGFVWGCNENCDVVAPVATPGANHGPQIPSAATAHSSNYGIALFSGPMVKQGGKRDRNRPYKMDDMGVTIAAVLGLPNCTQLEGHIMLDLLELSNR